MSTLRAAIWRAARGLDGGIETAARLLKRNPQTMRNSLVSQDRNKLDIGDAEAIIDLADSDELAIAAARQRGGVFIKLEGGHAESDLSDMALLELVTKVWRTSGDVGRVVDEVLADGRIDLTEVAKVREAITKAQQGLADMLRKVEVLAQ